MHSLHFTPNGFTSMVVSSKRKLQFIQEIANFVVKFVVMERQKLIKDPTNILRNFLCTYDTSIIQDDIVKAC